MSLPKRVFVIVLLPPGGRDPDRLILLHKVGASGKRITPVFSSMLLATTFLDRAQALGSVVPLDYIFPVSGERFAEDLPEYVPMLDISPENYFRVEAGGNTS